MSIFVFVGLSYQKMISLVHWQAAHLEVDDVVLCKKDSQIARDSHVALQAARGAAVS